MEFLIISFSPKCGLMEDFSNVEKAHFRAPRRHTGTLKVRHNPQERKNGFLGYLRLPTDFHLQKWQFTRMDRFV